MSYLKASYTDHSSCCDDFITGIQYLESRSIPAAVFSFRKACQSSCTTDQYQNKYLSYYGFARLLAGDFEGLRLCRDAVKLETRDGDVYFNLARAELFGNNRHLTIKAVEQGVLADQEHQGLKLLREKLGERRWKPVPFLSRKNPLNNLIGKCLRRKKN